MTHHEVNTNNHQVKLENIGISKDSHMHPSQLPLPSTSKRSVESPPYGQRYRQILSMSEVRVCYRPKKTRNPTKY